GCARTSCSITQGNSPSRISKLVPPPRKRCGIPPPLSRRINSGRRSCRRMRSRSVVPPMPSEVCSVIDAPARSSIPRSGSAARICGSSMRMVHGDPGSNQDGKLTQPPSYIACANGERGVAGARRVQQALDAFLHGAAENHIPVPGGADGVGQRFAVNTRDGRLARCIDIGQHEKIGVIERDRKSTRLNSSHGSISYAVFCLKKKNKENHEQID